MNGDGHGAGGNRESSANVYFWAVEVYGAVYGSVAQSMERSTYVNLENFTMLIIMVRLLTVLHSAQHMVWDWGRVSFAGINLR